MGHTISRAATVRLEYFSTGINNSDIFYLTSRHTVVRVYADTPQYYRVRHPQMLRFNPHNDKTTNVMYLDKQTGHIIPDYGTLDYECPCRWNALEYLPPIDIKS